MLRRLLLAVLATAFVGVGAAYAVVHHGLAADRAPGRIETAIARRLVVLSIPASTRGMRNPKAGDPEAWRAGANHFGEHCAVCHGVDGRGSTEFAANMYPPVPNLASPALQRMSDGALFAVVQNGVRWTGMPAFRSTHTADETWQLVAFIRHLPEMTPERSRPHHSSESVRTHSPHEVAMDGTSFSPPDISVHIGETVTWINRDPFPHNVTSSAGGFTSGDLDPDREWQFRAEKAGRFRYVCTLHPGMTGTLIVEP